MIEMIEMIQELIAMAKDIQSALSRGQEPGLSAEEEAFYDALASNDGQRAITSHCSRAG